MSQADRTPGIVQHNSVGERSVDSVSARPKASLAANVLITIGSGFLACLCAMVSDAEASTAIGLGLAIAGGTWLKLPKIIHC